MSLFKMIEDHHLCCLSFCWTQQLTLWCHHTDPVAFLLGVPRKDLLRVGELIGVKVIANEFVAYNALTSEAQYLAMSPRSKLIATYALCGMLITDVLSGSLLTILAGFGNLGSLGTQIGVLTQIAPSRAGDVSKVALSALFRSVRS